MERLIRGQSTSNPFSSSCTTTSSKRRRRADDDDDDDNVAPEVGDIVGAVDDSSTLRKPFVHFGKVLRVHPDKREVLLGHLVQQSSSSTAGRSKTYRLRIGGWHVDRAIRLTGVPG